MEKFVLLADRRSGTTLVIDCLNNLPRVHCEKRAFGIDRRVDNPDENRHSDMLFHYRMSSLSRRIGFHIRRKALLREFLDAEIFRPEGGKDVRGFRLIYTKVDQHPEILEALRDSGTKVIHLIRENVFKTYISHATAPLHKMHHPRAGDEVRTVRLHVDPEALLPELRRRSERIESMRQAVRGFPVLEVAYESFVADRQAEAARIQPFLGLGEVLPFHSDLVKINPDRLEDLVDNPDEVRAVLAGTEFARFLD